MVSGRGVKEMARRTLKAGVRRAGRETQARAAVGRLREAAAAFDPAARRELRDEHAMRLVLAAALRADSNAIDVGANQGAILSRIVTLAPAGRHLAFEPIPDLCEDLQRRFPGVDVRGSALSDQAGVAEFAHVVGAPAYSGLRLRADLPEGAGEVRRLSVQVQTLDEILEPGYVPALVKVDVEGGELGVLRGGVGMLERHRPTVLFEHGIGGADLYGSRPGDLHDLLTNAGLRVFDLDGTGPYGRGQFEETFTAPIWNFLATPA